MVQHPKVRDLKICIECRGPKERGLLVCWTCHHNMKRRHGTYSNEVQQCFDLIDAGKVRVIEQGDEKGRVVVA